MPQTQGHEFYHDDGVLRMQMLMSLNDMGKFCKFARHRDACCAIATADPFFSWKVQLRKPEHWPQAPALADLDLAGISVFAVRHCDEAA